MLLQLDAFPHFNESPIFGFVLKEGLPPGWYILRNSHFHEWALTGIKDRLEIFRIIKSIEGLGTGDEGASKVTHSRTAIHITDEPSFGGHCLWFVEFIHQRLKL